MKLLLRFAVVLVLLVAVLGAGAYLYLDRITAAVVEQGAGYATGTTTTVDSASVLLTKGRLGVHDVQVANPKLPEGGAFASPYFLKLGQGQFALDWSTAFDRTIRLPELTLDKLTLHLERKSGTSNHAIIRKRLEKLTGPDKKRPEDARQFVIDRILIKNVTITLHGYPFGKRTLNLRHPIELKDVGSDTESGVVAAEVTGVIVDAVFRSILADAGHFPEQFVQEVGSLFQKLKGFGDFGKQLLKDTGELLPGVGESSDEKENGPLKDLEKGIGDLFNGDEKKKNADQPAEEPAK